MITNVSKGIELRLVQMGSYEEDTESFVVDFTRRRMNPGRKIRRRTTAENATLTASPPRPYGTRYTRLACGD
jgi:hypothetical protein